ncbi:hypothetical protein ACFX13_038229 [Malus domestica]
MGVLLLLQQALSHELLPELVALAARRGQPQLLREVISARKVSLLKCKTSQLSKKFYNEIDSTSTTRKKLRFDLHGESTTGFICTMVVNLHSGRSSASIRSCWQSAYSGRSSASTFGQELQN